MAWKVAKAARASPGGHDLVGKVERHSFEKLTANRERMKGNSMTTLVLLARLLPAVWGVADETPTP